MKITLVADDTVRYEPMPGPLTIEAPSADKTYTAFHMLASALAQCTYDTVRSWASNAKLDADDLSVEVRLIFAERPHRASSFAVTLIWPSLPEERAASAKRAGELCAVHQTLAHQPQIETVVQRGALVA
jgi:uncharacterized OsmC-like protein